MKESNLSTIPNKDVLVANVSKIEKLEKVMLTMPQAEVPVKHHFTNKADGTPGLYSRECFIPQGITVTGKIHKHSHLTVISGGHAILVDEEGNKEVKAPYSFISNPGTKRAVYAITDCTFITFHPTEHTKVEDVEAEWIIKSLEEL